MLRLGCLASSGPGWVWKSARIEVSTALGGAIRPKNIAADHGSQVGSHSALIDAELSDERSAELDTDDASIEVLDFQDQAGQNPSRERPPAADRRAPDNNSALMASGREAFNRDCTACHDAQRALAKRTSVSGWRSTIRRMASKSGANIPTADWDAIATYLTAQGNPAVGTAGEGAAGGTEKSAADKDSETPSLSVFGTFSPLFRGGNDNLQNPGFFPKPGSVPRGSRKACSALEPRSALVVTMRKV